MKVVFLDRDGVINVDNGEVYRIDQWDFTLGAVKSLSTLRDCGFKLAIVTNQRKIAEGVCTEEDVQNLHAWLNKQFRFDAIAYCPHPVEMHCGCRKPEIGMASQIEEKIGKINYQESWMIGDKPSDMAFGKKLGMRTILIRSKHAAEDENADYCVASLKEAAFLIKNSHFVFKFSVR
jgi:D-glycero-D-manno-heptose 1,7-bisphosphate phosphatase